MASVDEFLQTGRLGLLSVGLSKEEVLDLLGERPESVSVQRTPEIWKYGSLQLGFYSLRKGSDPSLVSITLSFHNPEERLPQALALEGWVPDRETTYEEFRAHLVDAGIEARGGGTSGPDQYLVFGSSIRVTFDEGRLFSIGYTSQRESRVKQITVNIPSSDLETIRREAAARGVSISALCSRWIGERVANLQPQ